MLNNLDQEETYKMTDRKDSKLRPFMLGGTGSDVGKSIVATAFCRIFLQDGYRPAPFKAQNMALNSFITADGLEIGRAQAVQAEAAVVPCQTDMNPILLKPTGNKSSQLVLNGKVAGNQSAQSYFRKEGRSELRKAVNDAFDRLATNYNPIVMEGAGSIAEINLREVDLVNMSMAIHANAAVVLVADIDRGGVFASIYGTVMLMTPQERKHLKGVIINKFRGDIKLFESGIKIIEDLCKIPVLGVIPHYTDIHIEEEDSVTLETKSRLATEGKINIVVVLLKHLSNYTDFNVLERDPRVHMFYSNNTEEIKKADIILIPGTKNTISDLYEIRKNGVAQSIIKAHKNGVTVVGICGGYQMMGLEVCDTNQVEGEIERFPGLNLLPVITELGDEKVTRQVEFNFLDQTQAHCKGYEIHMGTTSPTEEANDSPVNRKLDGTTDGYFLNEKCFGTYIHGILDNSSVIEYLLAPYSEKLNAEPLDIEAFKNQQYDKLAAHVRKHVDMELVYKILKETE